MREIIEVGEKQNGQQIEMNWGQTLRVTLPEVRTSGFRWSLRACGERVLSPAGDDLDSASGATGATGGVAQHHWVFRAAAAGATELFFEYDRPWVRAPAAARTFTVSVRVREGAAQQSG
jgi:predicted secreted protein